MPPKTSKTPKPQLPAQGKLGLASVQQLQRRGKSLNPVEQTEVMARQDTHQQTNIIIIIITLIVIIILLVKGNLLWIKESNITNLY